MFPRHYTLKNARRAFANPMHLVDELFRVKNKYYYNWIKRPELVMNKDWDNLIILDACRYDAFSEVINYEGELASRITVGPSSRKFVSKTFSDHQYHDTVYVSANAYLSEIQDGTFHKTFPVDLTPIANSQDVGGYISQSDVIPDESYAALPETVCSDAQIAQKEFPDKRLMVHFMQPHLPFIGQNGIKLYEHLLSKCHDQNELLPTTGSRQRWGTLGIRLYDYINADWSDITDEDLWNAYLENLELVLDHVKRLSHKLDGKTVITADHGEMIGEQLFPFGQRWYGHHSTLHSEELRVVPWFVVEGTEERKDIKPEPPVKSDRMTNEQVEEKLKALGYA